MQLCMIQKNMESPLSCFVYTAFLRDAGNCLYPIPSNSMYICLLYTSDAADDSLRVDLGGRRIIKKKKM